jgi:hypothetical protein
MICTPHPEIFGVIKRWAGHAARMGEKTFKLGFGGET